MMMIISVILQVAKTFYVRTNPFLSSQLRMKMLAISRVLSNLDLLRKIMLTISQVSHMFSPNSRNLLRFSKELWLAIVKRSTLLWQK